MTLVTFDTSIPSSKSESEPQTTVDDSTKAWKEGCAERIRSLEAALSAVVRRKQHEQQHYHHAKQSYALEPDYGSMLDGESGDGDSNNGDQSRSSDENGDGTWSDSSSFYCSEGQPLLCTYQPPAAPESAATPYAAAYGSLSGTTIGAKSPEQYLPWDVRARNCIQALCFSGCACLATRDSDSNGS
ncbi:hypothetical protein EV178_005620 [Coemansia sp. RSA 1646]|nr:hypothetical protein EV178_005620 [Coemansia sp. RSA 1646]